MIIHIQFYSRLKEAASPEPVEWETQEGATVATVLEELFARYPELRAWDRHLLLAVGVEYVNRDCLLQPGDTLSVMPPVQGG